MRTPADWEVHQRSWIGLPAVPELWQQRFHAARQTVVDIANRIVDFEPVNLVCPSGYGSFLTSYTDSRIEIVEIDLGESWFGDVAPTYVESNSGKVKAMFTKTNRALPCYQTMRRRLCDNINIASSTLPISIENGAITTDGEGTGICTRKGVFSDRRNNQDHISTIEKKLARSLGLQNIIWLKRGLVTDHVTGHVTNLVRFIGPSTVLLANHGNTNDPNKGVTIDTYDQLSSHSTRDSQRRKIAVYQVHNPPPIVYKGIHLNTSYTNFYIANNAVIIPSFYKPNYDRKAFELFQELFPGYEVIQYPVLPLLTGGGGIHCSICPQILGSKEIVKIKHVLHKDKKPVSRT